MIYFSGAAKAHITNYLKERTDSNEALFVGKHKPFNRMTKGEVEGKGQKPVALSDRNASRVAGVKI